MKHLLLLFLLLTGLNTLAQDSSAINGIVTDTKGTTLPGATVFLTNTQHITVTDNAGKFSFAGLEPGNYEVVIKMIGFVPYVQKTTLTNETVSINATLKDDNVQLNEVVISVADPNRPKYLAQFTKYFIGESTNADECKLINPEVVKIHFDKVTGILTAHTDKLLTIENRGLGYRLNYLVTDFKFDQKNLTMAYTGYPYFEELKGSVAQQKRWEANRKTAYLNSMSHFFKATYNNTAEAEGFMVYALSGNALINGLPDNISNVSAASLFLPASLGLKTLKPAFDQHSAGDTTALFVYYRGGNEPYSFSRSGMYIRAPDKLKLPGKGQLSKLEPLTNGIQIDNNGGVNPQQGFLVSGYWAWTKIAELVPNDYHLPEQQTISTRDAAGLNAFLSKIGKYSTRNPTEKIYLQLNKPWYNRADTIWFKAYTVVGSKHQLSTLSDVAYVELINAKDSVIKKLNLKLRSGVADGDFSLPITLSPGTYRIRAYTNWMKNNGDEGFYDQQIVIGNPFTTVEPTKKEKKAAASTLVVVAKLPVVQFFPESGSLVSGLRNVVAFKALNPDGMPANVKGSITTADGNTVAEFESSHAGMGAFAITPQDGQTYMAKLQFNNGNTQTVNLPAAEATGYTLTVNNREKDTLLVKIAANPYTFKTDKGKSFYIIAQGGGNVCYTTLGKLNEATYSIRISKDHFPSGIVRLTLFSETGEPLNERVIFIQQPDNLDLELTADKPNYITADKVTMNLNTSFEKQPTMGNFSAAVINEDKTPVDENTESNIFSQLLLSSELHGRIADPGYYFKTKNDQTVNDLDLLMLTQGYRKLEWKKILDTTAVTPKYLAENGLAISGTITTLNGKPVANAKVSLLGAEQLLRADTVTDASGRFIFAGIDIKDKAPLIIKAYNGKSNDVHILLDQTPLLTSNGNFYHSRLTDSALIPSTLRKSYHDEEQLYLKTKSKQIKEVTIKANRDPNKQDIPTSVNTRGAGNADEVISGKRLAEMGCPIVLDCLRYGMTMSFRAKKVVNDNLAVTYINGAIGNINNITTQEITSIEILASVKYLSVYGTDAAHGIIFITTKQGVPGSDEPPTEKAPGLLTFTFDGFYKARKFYVPQYNEANATDQQPSAIYWQPNIITGKDGKFNLQYNNAGKGNYRLVVEGIDIDGRLGRAVYRYKVE